MKGFIVFRVLLLLLASFVVGPHRSALAQQQGHPPLVFKDELVLLGEYCPWEIGIHECPETKFFVNIIGSKQNKTLERYDERKEERRCSVYRNRGTYKIRGCAANFLMRAESDPLRGKQWALEQARVAEAWERFPTSSGGSSSIAIVDTGVDCGHPDLECVKGYDAITEEKGWIGIDPNGHGTHVAGIAAGIRDNGVGIAGVSPSAVIPIRVLAENGAGSLYTVAKGLNHVLEMDTGVINLSLGSFGGSAILCPLVERAINQQKTVVAAAGNDGQDLNLQPQYPCACPGAVCVGAVKQGSRADDIRRATWSNYGDRVSVWAPGEGILSTWPDSKYLSLSGTSMAAPMVAGAIALTGKVPSGALDVALLAGVSLKGCKAKKARSCYQTQCCSRRRKKRCRKKCRRTWNCKRGEVRRILNGR